MRHIYLLRTLAMSSALLLALGSTGFVSGEDTSNTVESPSVEAVPPPAEASEEAADETTPPAAKSDTEASEAEKE